MKSRRASKSASCLYMLGFLSGLIFIMLCGSSAAYNELRNPHPESNIAGGITTGSSPNDFLQSTTASTEDIKLDIAILDTNEFDVQALGFEPSTQVEVRMENGGQVLATKTATADGIGNATVVFDPLKEILGSVDFVASSGTTVKRVPYPIPPSYFTTSTPTIFTTNTPTQQSTTPTDTPTASPTPVPLPPKPSDTIAPSPTPTLTPSPTPIPMEAFYPNWRAEYYNNTTWAGPPIITRDDRDIAFSWGESSPAPGAIGQNWFSARWTRRVVLPEGYYNFVLSADDQAEVYANGQKLLSYMGKSPSVNQASRYIQGFEVFDFEVKYIEYWGDAHIQFYWEPVGTNAEAGDGCCWTAVYYQGANIFGEPVSTEAIPGNTLRLSWGQDKPLWQTVGLGSYFSARFTRQIQAPVQPGNYHLCVYVNDTVRLWMDRNQLVYHCDCGERSCLVCSQVYLGNNPPHHLNLEYSHTLGKPFLGFYVVPAKEGEPWVGAFFDDPNMDRPPVVVRTAPNIDFDWQQFAPPDTGLYYDNFSVRWQRTMELVHGQYTFHVLVDDGARLRVNGRTIINQWEVGNAREFTGTYDVLGDSERAQIELDYYDYTIMAVIKLWWDAPPPTPTPLPTMTPDP